MIKKILRITLKVFMWIFICVFALILVAVIALQFPQTQKFLTGKAVTFLENKIKTRVEVGGINVAFPKSVVLEDIYLEDQKKDTLLYGHKIALDIDLLGLIKNKVQVNNIELEKITGHVQRTLPDSAFNFDYIIEAFATDSAKEQKPEDTTKSQMEIKVMGLELNDIFLTFQDEVTGTDALVKLGEFELEMDKFDLNKKEFVVDFIELHNTRASLVQTKLPTSTQDPESQPLDVHFDLGKLDVSNIDLVYDNQVNKQKIDLNLGELLLEPNKIDLIKQNIDLDELELNNTSIVYTQGKSVVKDTLVHEKVAKKVGDELEQESKESGRPWTVTLNELQMVANSLKFDDFNSPASAEGIDFKHMKVDGLGMDIENISYSGLNVAADINQFVFREKSGFRINDFEAKVRMDSTSAKLTDLNLKTNKTHLRNHLEIRYPSLTTIGDNIGNLGLNVNLDHCSVAFEDILYFQPALAKNPPFAGNETNVIQLTGRLKGKVTDLSIPNFELLALNSTVLQASGRIKGLPDMEKAFIDMKVSKLASTSKDIYDLLPQNTIPATISIPPNINIDAYFKGYLNNFDANAIVKTSYGGMTAKMNMDPPKNGKEVYKANLRIDNFQVNKLMKNDSLYGPVSLRADVDGVGFDPKSMVANIDASIQKAVFKGYPYQNLNIDGRIIQKQFIGKIDYSDSNLVFAFNGDLNFNKEQPKMKFLLDLKGADFKALKLTEQDMRFKTKVAADFSGIDMNNINGDVKITETLIIQNGRNYNVDNFLFASINEKRKTDIKVESDILDAKFAGTINLGDLTTTVKQHINQYFSLNDPEIKKPTEPQNFVFDIDIKDSDLLTDVLVPGLNKLKAAEISGKFSSNNNDLDIRFELPEVGYNNISIQDFLFTINSNQSALDYEMAIQSARQDSTEIKNIALGGSVKDNQIGTAFSISDDKQKEKFLIGGILKSVQKAFQFKFQDVILDYDRWTVNNDNYLQFGSKQFFANNVKLEHQGQYLLLNTVNRKEPVPDFLVEMKDFRLSFITGLIENNQLAVGGAIDGKVILEKFPGGGSFTSDLKISDFSFKNDTLGTITLLANNTTQNKYEVNLTVKGEGNDIQAGGYYLANAETNILNFDVDINNIDLSTIESYTAGQATRMSGSLVGDFAIRGSTKSPKVDGELTFREAGFNVTYLKSYFLVDNETISLDNRGIHFDTFTIKDERNNTASIDGSVLTPDFKEIKLALAVNTNDFRVLNTNEEDNELFYGTVLIDSKIRITGTTTAPKIDASINLEKATDFTFAIPTADPSKDTGEGVYVFKDFSNKVNPILKQEASADTIKSELSGINLTASISIDKDALFNIVIDKERGDILNLKGSTNEMVFALDQSGKITLSGRYVINEGNYKLSFYKLVNKNFEMYKGSTITWSGEPLDAQVDIKAFHTVETASGTLMNDAQNGRYMNKLPFQVFLNMKGALMKPTISFDIKLPEEEANQNQDVALRLNMLNQSESERNQQVFALIILGGFIKESSFETGNQSSLASTARGSVSEVLSQQLNNLSDRFVKGVDINVGVESEERFNDQGVGRNSTNLELGVSKQFFNDRVEVQVGSSINLEGESNANESATAGNIVGDMSVLYRLTDDGRYKLKAFRESDYDQTMQGNVIKTGVSLVFLREYNKLSELLRKSEEEEELKVIEEEE